MLNPGNIHYEMADRARGITYGGMGVVQLLVKNLGLGKAIDSNLRIFKIRNPYFESDHIFLTLPTISSATANVLKI
jgi:hypothetical protein